MHKFGTNKRQHTTSAACCGTMTANHSYHQCQAKTGSAQSACIQRWLATSVGTHSKHACHSRTVHGHCGLGTMHPLQAVQDKPHVLHVVSSALVGCMTTPQHTLAAYHCCSAIATLADCTDIDVTTACVMLLLVCSKANARLREATTCLYSQRSGKLHHPSMHTQAEKWCRSHVGISRC